MAKREEAVASNPGQLPFSFVQYMRCYPALLAFPPATAGFGIICALLKGLAIWIALSVGTLMALVALPALVTAVKRKLQDGNLCAARVVSVAPFTVAVLSDLCNDRSTPKLAVKITKAPLQNMAGGAPKAGDKLVAVSTYFGDNEPGAWKDFHPLIANCACSNLVQIKRALDSIDPNDCLILAQAMKSLKPTDLGLHYLQV